MATIPTIHEAVRSPTHERLSSWFGERVRVVVILLLYLLGMEAIAYGAAFALVQRNLLYYPPAAAQAVGGNGSAEQGLEIDPILGWPSRQTLVERYDAYGARVDPYYPLPHKTCVSLYGGSFTFGESVSNEHTWGAQLSRILGCRVANYGVEGYGTDQSYLRYSINQSDDAPVVILSYFAGDIRRNINQLRNLLSVERTVRLKPRFIFERELLTYVPPPRIATTQVNQLFAAPSTIVPHEYFLPGTLDGTIEAKFPYTVAVGRFFLSRQLQTQTQFAPWWADFYDLLHPSKALQISVGIIERFVREAVERDQSPVVVLVPDPSDLVYSRLHGKFVYSSLQAALGARGINAIDLGQKMIEEMHGQSPCEFAASDRCSGGFNERGNRLVAALMSAMFQGSVAPPAQQPTGGEAQRVLVREVT
jgi:hypothetical protein